MIFFHDVILNKTRQKLKIQEVFAKQQTLIMIPIPFLKNIFEYLYENSLKQFFHGKNDFFLYSHF